MKQEEKKLRSEMREITDEELEKVTGGLGRTYQHFCKDCGTRFPAAVRSCPNCGSTNLTTV